MTVEATVEELRAAAAGAQGAVAALRDLRAQVDDHQQQLENPNAVREYIDFFRDFLTRAASELTTIAGELGSPIQPAQLDALRQIASNSAAEQRRAGLFRDKWINKPLPYETMRPLLSGISNTTREQIESLRRLSETAAKLQALNTPDEPLDPKGRDRRELFNRLFRPGSDG